MVKTTPRKPKAAREAEKQSRQLSRAAILKLAGRAAAFLVVAGIASPVSQLNLSPVYGSIPASLHHQRAVSATALLAFIGRGTLKRYLPTNIADYIAVIAYWTPVVQYFLFQYSARLGIEYGPLLVEGLTYLPLLFLCCLTAGNILDSLHLSEQLNLPYTPTGFAVPLTSYATLSFVSKLAAYILPSYIGTHIYFTRVGFQALIGSALAFLAPSRVIFLAFPAILHTLFANPHHPSDSAFQKANATLYASTNFTMLARQESVTGYVSVLENDADNAFRLLRCDHSLLGGEWLVTETAYKHGQRQREPIFSVFVLLEAVRLVEDLTGVPESKKAALNIGLGIGTAPNALIAHGINTTIVELDPVVHYYASKYFSLSSNHTAVIADAVSYVAATSQSAPESYDYIIHDVFTGGAEPVSLFTLEFFEGLKALLRPNGVVAINYAGDLALGSTRLVLNTIHAVFPSCRLFRDSPQAEGWQPGDPDFINMVVFCVKDKRGKDERGRTVISFREPTEDDFRGSIARRNFLKPRDELEIGFEFAGEENGASVMRRKDVGELEKWHERGAVSHWRIMRTVLPDKVWEMW